jgi:hypothetical protein
MKSASEKTLVELDRGILRQAKTVARCCARLVWVFDGVWQLVSGLTSRTTWSYSYVEHLSLFYGPFLTWRCT